ncbi:MAG: PaaI family thioesterase [Burkholderiales bacterium]|nr:MAG: PaaI family thioesterase [Burkholderiales bacterium]
MTDAPDNYILRLIRGEAPQHPIGETLGARILELDLAAGRLEMEFVGTDAFRNPAGTVQGGMLAAMLDDVTASLATATATQDERCATLDLHTSFLRPAKVGPIRASARVVRRGREIVHVAGELSQDGRPVATATATCMLVAPRPGG